MVFYPDGDDDNRPVPGSDKEDEEEPGGLPGGNPPEEPSVL